MSKYCFVKFLSFVNFTTHIIKTKFSAKANVFYNKTLFSNKDKQRHKNIEDGEN